MGENGRRELGLFRYALIRDASDPALSKAERGRLVRALADQEHVGPDGRLVRVARGTVDRWVRAYRHGGFEALVPQPRVVAPRTPVEMLELAFQLKRERPERTAAQVREIMLAAGDGPVPGLRTLQRHLARQGLNIPGPIDELPSVPEEDLEHLRAGLKIGVDMVALSFVRRPEDITFLRSAGNRLFCWLVNRLYKTSYTDLCYGYNAFWRNALPAIVSDCSGFEVETVLNVRAAKAGLRVVEVPSVEHPRIHGRSNLRPVRDGLRVLRTILREREHRPLSEPAVAIDIVGADVEVVGADGFGGA